MQLCTQFHFLDLAFKISTIETATNFEEKKPSKLSIARLRGRRHTTEFRRNLQGCNML